MRNRKQEVIDLLEMNNHSHRDIADVVGVGVDEVCEIANELYDPYDHIHPEYDDPMADAMELGCEDYFSQWDDDPSPYGGTYSEM